jgi:hypothetical protein
MGHSSLWCPQRQKQIPFGNDKERKGMTKRKVDGEAGFGGFGYARPVDWACSWAW